MLAPTEPTGPTYWLGAFDITTLTLRQYHDLNRLDDNTRGLSMTVAGPDALNRCALGRVTYPGNRLDSHMQVQAISYSTDSVRPDQACGNIGIWWTSSVRWYGTDRWPSDKYTAV